MPRESYNGHTSEELGKLAYEAYLKQLRHQTPAIYPKLPEWGFLPSFLQEAWITSAITIGDLLLV